LGGREGIWPVKKLSDWVLAWFSVWNRDVNETLSVWTLERDAYLHMAQMMTLPHTVSCFNKIQICFTFLVLAHPGSPGQRAVKRVCECVCSFSNLLESDMFMLVLYLKTFFTIIFCPIDIVL